MQADRKTLIVGATGQVGAAMVRHWSSVAGAESVLPAARTASAGSVQVDLEALTSVAQAAELLDGLPLGPVLCVAGWTYVDGCEADPARAFQVNADGPAALAAYARSRDLPFVYYSTDYLFDGSEANPGPYTERSSPAPINVYGRSKLQGEQSVLAAHPDALVIRTAGVYGYDTQGKNYLYTVLKTLTKGTELRVPEDQVSTPAYNADLARATYVLLQNAARGVYHACGPDVLGRLELARLIAAEFGLADSLLEGISTATMKQPALRPLLAGLDSSKLQTEFPEAKMRGVRDAISDCRSQLGAAIRAWQAE